MERVSNSKFQTIMVLKGKLYFLIIYLFLLSSCISKNENRETGNSSVASELVKEDYEDNEIECQDVDFEDATQDFPDGSYCAEVQYENPNTGTQSTYTLTIEVESNEVVKVDFPNGGWMDRDHFSGADLDEDGRASFTSDKGYNYEIQIIGDADDCMTDDVPLAQQCIGITEDGDQCKNMTDNSNGLCWQHQDQE
ncbi:MAG: hypothetical protein U0Y08_06000 [Bacteroidia bacterium]